MLNHDVVRRANLFHRLQRRVRHVQYVGRIHFKAKHAILLPHLQTAWLLLKAHHRIRRIPLRPCHRSHACHCANHDTNQARSNAAHQKRFLFRKNHQTHKCTLPTPLELIAPDTSLFGRFESRLHSRRPIKVTGMPAIHHRQSPDFCATLQSTLHHRKVHAVKNSVSPWFVLLPPSSRRNSHAHSFSHPQKKNCR